MIVQPDDERFSGFVFKVQANMDPSHRDRIAFLRVCSGKFTSDIEVHHYRLDKTIRLKRPQGFFGQEREAIDEAWAGDVIGLFDPGCSASATRSARADRSASTPCRASRPSTSRACACSIR